MRLLIGLFRMSIVFACTATLSAADGKKGAPTAAGKVKAIDAKAGSLTLEGRKGDGGKVVADQAFMLAKDVKVTAGKDAKTIEDVKAGAQVTLTLTEDRKTVTAIALAGARAKEGGNK